MQEHAHRSRRVADVEVERERPIPGQRRVDNVGLTVDGHLVGSSRVWSGNRLLVGPAALNDPTDVVGVLE